MKHSINQVQIMNLRCIDETGSKQELAALNTGPHCRHLARNGCVVLESNTPGVFWGPNVIQVPRKSPGAAKPGRRLYQQAQLKSK